MSSVSASAPGKLVLSGEYAVLRGATAIAMAIDVRARARVRGISGTASTVVAPGFTDDVASFTRDGDGVYSWSGCPYPLLESVLDAVAPWPSPALSLELDTRRFRDESSGRKFGFGSSAALATALSASILTMSGRARELPALACAAHRSFQRGMGSGVDVAASLSGGVIAYRMNDGAACQPLAWPGGLAYRILWSGRPADTAARLQTLGLHGFAERPALRGLVESANRVASRWPALAAAESIVELRQYVQALRDFDAELNAGIFGGGH